MVISFPVISNSCAPNRIHEKFPVFYQSYGFQLGSFLVPLFFIFLYIFYPVFQTGPCSIFFAHFDLDLAYLLTCLVIFIGKSLRSKKRSMKDAAQTDDDES